jgi:hypothetical protein
MKTDTLAEENNAFVACAEEARRTSAGDKKRKAAHGVCPPTVDPTHHPRLSSVVGR